MKFDDKFVCVDQTKEITISTNLNVTLFLSEADSSLIECIKDGILRMVYDKILYYSEEHVIFIDDQGKPPLYLTLLYFFSYDKKHKIVEALLSKGVYPNVTDINNTYTILELASNFANLETIKLLVQNGADVNGKNYIYNTPIFGAASSVDGIPKLKLLLENGADVNVRNSFGRSVIDFTSTKYDKKTTLEFLKQYGFQT